MAGPFKYQANGQEPEGTCPGRASSLQTADAEKGDLLSSFSSLSYFVEAPKLSDKTLFGVVGTIIRKIEPHTETHPAALLVQLLVGAGNIIGRGPHILTERDEQHTNLFGVIVGESSRGRKGTSWGHVCYILAQVDAPWKSFKVMGGLASGEGVIAELRDDENGNDERQDKRLLLMEGEFAQVLRVLQRDGNTLSPIIRNAWDSGNLRNMSKGCPLRATGCHISVIGHITRTELSRLLTPNDAANGFANRILWVYSSRTRLLPDGGEIQSEDFTKEIEALRIAIRSARNRGEIKLSEEARRYWHEIYLDLTKDLPGRWGEVTSRSEAQVLRLALIYCLLDGGECIQVSHLQAAEALWNYCSESARWAFVEFQFSRNAQKLLAALESGPLALAQISKDVFRGNLEQARIEAALHEIKDRTIIVRHATRGRDATVISLRQ
jgi:hypothetical protein